MDPGPSFVGLGGDLLEGVEGTGVHIAGLRAENGRAGDRRQRVGTHPALAVCRHPDHAAASEAEQAEALHQRRMDLVSDHHGHRRRPGQSPLVNVPPGPGQHGVTRRGERGEVGHRRAGHEARDRRGRQAEELDQPALRHLLERGGDGRGRERTGVLVPRRGQPVGGHSHRVRATDDEPEESWAGGGHGRRRAGLVEQRDHALGVVRAIRQRLVEAPEAGERIDVRRDAAVRQLAQVVDGPLGGRAQQFVHGSALFDPGVVQMMRPPPHENDHQDADGRRRRHADPQSSAGGVESSCASRWYFRVVATLPGVAASRPNSSPSISCSRTLSTSSVSGKRTVSSLPMCSGSR